MNRVYVYRAVHDTVDMGTFAYLDTAMRTLERVARVNNLSQASWKMPQPHLENIDGEVILECFVGDTPIPQYITKHEVQE